MNKYLKKFGIMFVMTLAIIGIGAIQNGVLAKAATVGSALTSPESGWTRYDDNDSKIKYGGSWGTVSDAHYYNGIIHYSAGNNSTITFKFYGTKLRLIADKLYSRPSNVLVNIDGASETFSEYSPTQADLGIDYEKKGLTQGIHIVTLSCSTAANWCLDAIDIDDTGCLLPIDYNKSIVLDNTTINLIEGDSDSLIATTTPSGLGVAWKSSDESVAKYDPTIGKVIAVGEGTCTITATLDDGYNVSVGCTINVTKKAQEESITLGRSSMDLTEGDTQQLTATTTPAGAQVTWSSSDNSIATVDSTGNVTGIKEGQVTITATTADGLTATCTVNVIPKGTDPTEPTGDANLYIELVDGQIKQYTASSDEINKFTTWYENRDKDHSLLATYKFAKGTYKDYVVHDQIDWFEVR